MRCMRRNKTLFYYSLYEDKRPVVNENGFVTGEYEIQYSNPIECHANISAAVGAMAIRQFGDSENYDKVIVADSLPIDEHTILWIDVEPMLDENGELAKDENGRPVTPHDYIVKKVAKSLNSVSVAISKVKVNE